MESRRVVNSIEKKTVPTVAREEREKGRAGEEREKKERKEYRRHGLFRKAPQGL